MENNAENNSSPKSNKKKLIIDAAMELFRDRGFANSRIIDIANNAGIGKGTVYAYFDSKEDILLEILDMINNDDFSNMQKTLKSEGNVYEKFNHYIEQVDALVGKYSIYLNIYIELLNSVPSSGSQKVIETVNLMVTNLYKIMCDFVNQGIERGELSRNVSADAAAVFIMTIMSVYLSLKTVKYNKDFGKECEVFKRHPFGAAVPMDKAELVEFIFNGIGASEIKESLSAEYEMKKVGK